MSSPKNQGEGGDPFTHIHDEKIIPTVRIYYNNLPKLAKYLVAIKQIVIYSTTWEVVGANNMMMRKKKLNVIRLLLKLLLISQVCVNLKVSMNRLREIENLQGLQSL